MQAPLRAYKYPDVWAHQLLPRDVQEKFGISEPQEPSEKIINNTSTRDERIIAKEPDTKNVSEVTTTAKVVAPDSAVVFAAPSIPPAVVYMQPPNNVPMHVNYPQYPLYFAGASPPIVPQYHIPPSVQQFIAPPQAPPYSVVTPTTKTPETNDMRAPKLVEKANIRLQKQITRTTDQEKKNAHRVQIIAFLSLAVLGLCVSFLFGRLLFRGGALQDRHQGNIAHQNSSSATFACPHCTQLVRLPSS